MAFNSQLAIYHITLTFRFSRLENRKIEGLQNNLKDLMLKYGTFKSGNSWKNLSLRVFGDTNRCFPQ